MFWNQKGGGKKKGKTQIEKHPPYPYGKKEGRQIQIRVQRRGGQSVRKDGSGKKEKRVFL